MDAFYQKNIVRMKETIAASIVLARKDSTTTDVHTEPEPSEVVSKPSKMSSAPLKSPLGGASSKTKMTSRKESKFSMSVEQAPSPKLTLHTPERKIISTKERGYEIDRSFTAEFFTQRNLLQSTDIQDELKCVIFIDGLEDFLMNHWILCRHVALIVFYFRQGRVALVPVFGSFTVDLLVVLFPRILDIQNIDIVLELMSPQDVAAFLCRVGILNVFNPNLLSAGAWQLNCGRYEERQVAKLLVAMSVVESGLLIIRCHYFLHISHR